MTGRSRRSAPRASGARPWTPGGPTAILLLAVSWAAGLACLPDRPEPDRPEVEEREARVTATAFNTLPGQTAGDPRVTAWGDTLRPGMRAIAVSRDLERMGLTHGTRVEIEGRRGEYVVRDRMAARWQRRIDIYKGEDVEAAREWGRRTVTIRWTAPPDSPDP